MRVSFFAYSLLVDLTEQMSNLFIEDLGRLAGLADYM
jgi:hypothetical protein